MYYISFVDFFFFYLNSHKIGNENFLLCFRNILVASYLELWCYNYNDSFITRINSRFRTINFIFKMVLCLDDLALLDCLQFLIIFVLCKFIIQNKYYLSVEIFLNDIL